MSTYLYYGDTLYHHGTKGQKWGVRKYQNEDGSLTPAGREHYGYGQARAKYEAQKMIYKSAKKDARNAYLDAYAYNNRHPISKLTNKNVAKKLNQKQVNAAMYERASKEAKENMKAAKQEYKNSDEYKARQEKIKKAAKIGLAVAGTALAAYGAYKVSEVIKDKNRIDAGKRAAMNLYNANAPATTYARQSKLDGKVYYKMKNVYGDTIQKGSAKDFDSYRKIVSDRRWEATQQHAKAINDLRAKKRR